MAGSSPAPTAVALPSDPFGTPALLVSEDWVKKGVAITILNAVDRSSVALFAAILVVCALFVANSAAAAVRGRRHELGVLAALGWTRPRLFVTVLGEVAVTGLIAGLLGAAASLPLAAALGFHASPARALLAIPVAVGLAVVAGAVPAWLAARADPVAAVRPPVLAVRRARHPSSITGLAVVNVLRTPGRTLIGALALTVGVTALTLLIAITMAFRGTAVGTLLGNVVTVQVRGVDYIAVAATIALGVLAVADALRTSITERAPESGHDPRVRLARAGAAPSGDHRGRSDRGRQALGSSAPGSAWRALPSLPGRFRCCCSSPPARRAPPGSGRPAGPRCCPRTCSAGGPPPSYSPRNEP